MYMTIMDVTIDWIGSMGKWKNVTILDKIKLRVYKTDILRQK